MSHNSTYNYQIGMIGEIAFLERTTKLNLVVSIPFHQDTRYDMILDHNKTLYKVQVKSSQAKQPGRNGYRFQVSSNRTVKKLYGIDEIDYFACYAIDIDTFWIIPYEVLGNQKTVYITPDNPKYLCYKECFDFN